jgi:hypothetical protein
MRWLGVFIASQPLLVVGWILLEMGAPDNAVRHRTVTVHCPLRATSAQPLGFGAVDRWRPLSSSYTGQSGAIWLLRSDFWHALFFCAESRWRAGSRCSAGSPDSPMPHWTVRWIIMEHALEFPRVAGSESYGHGAPNTVRWAIFQHTQVLLLQLNCVPNLIYFLVYIEPYAPVIHEFYAN